MYPKTPDHDLKTQKYPIDNSFCKYARYPTRTRSFYQYPNPIRPEVENTYPLGLGVNCKVFFFLKCKEKLSWVAYLGLCIFCILLCLKLYSRP